MVVVLVDDVVVGTTRVVLVVAVVGRARVVLEVVVGGTVVVLVELVVEVVGRLVVVDVVVVTGQATQHGMLGSCWIVAAGTMVAPVVTGAGGWRYVSRF